MLGPGDYEEKRDFRRMDVDCPLVIRTGGGEMYTGIARDLSATGLLVECEQALAEGTEVEVELTPEKALMPPLKARCEVLRVAPKGDGFELGIVIRQMLG